MFNTLRGSGTVAPALSIGLALIALGLVISNALAVTQSALPPAAAVTLILLAWLIHVRLVHWRLVLASLIVLILFIPIRRYTIAVNVPFQLEPYRVLVAILVGAWILSLLADPRIHLRRSGLEKPLFLVAGATFASVLANGGRVSSLEDDVLKTLTFFTSFLLVFYLIVSIVRTREDVELLLKTLLLGGAALSVLSIVESRTGYNPFDNLEPILPFMHLDPSFDGELSRGARFRASGSAEHPIALGAMLAMLVPLAFVVARRAGKWYWWLIAALLGLGAFSTQSRTVVLMLVAAVIVFAALRPREALRLWPLGVLLVVAMHFAIPGTIGTLKDALLPEGGLIAEQRGAAGTVGSGRVADLAPSLAEWAKKPLFGSGYGTRITTGPEANSFVLDNQWLGTLLETGAAGIVAWLWLFGRFIRRASAVGKEEDTDRGWLLVGLGAAVAAYAVGMFTFDAFSFVQVTFVLFILLAVGAVLAFGREPVLERTRPPRSPRVG